MASYSSQKKQLISKYGRVCFLGGVINDSNIVTVHHMTPQRTKIGDLVNEISNLFLVGRLEHQIINMFEINNLDELLAEINFYLKYFHQNNDSKYAKRAHDFLLCEASKLGYYPSEQEYFEKRTMQVEKIMVIKKRPMNFNYVS